MSRFILLTLLLLLISLFNKCDGNDTEFTPSISKKVQKAKGCYDSFNRPQRCIPEFINAAFNIQMEATNTCGENGAADFCIQTGSTGMKKSCDTCYLNQHHARYLTDFHQEDNITWWQSDTMFEIYQQYLQQVNLTLNLGKSFDITYVRIWFYSPRPESFAIYKRTREDGPWIPYQFYSATCRDTYGLPDTIHANKGEEARALCTSEYSDISPLINGNVAFSTLEGRPSAYYFDTSSELQEWVTATDIRISLDRMNTFGDEIFGDPQVLKSYFYAIADIAVGARCKCNGHASECTTSTGIDGSTRRVCKCQHNTAGPDCNECLPFYNDAPWGRATFNNTHECKPCNCNGFSNRCFFDRDLYSRTGHGGHCLDCASNRDGPNCERCRENYYQREDDICVACNCDPIGSRILQCNTHGKCPCKAGVTGDKCDRCEDNYYDFGNNGCKSCGCSEAGSINNRPSCDPYTGTCYCKENVEGKRCRECKFGYFNLDVENEFGCTPCFCYRHSSECMSATGYAKYQIESSFIKSNEKWKAVDEYGRLVDTTYHGLSQSLAVTGFGPESVYFLAPDRYLGDQRASYNQLLKFSLRIGENGPTATARDIILEGSEGHVANTIFAQRNQIPTMHKQEYIFRLHEHADYGWQPRKSARDFISILTNLTAIKIRGTYTPQGVGFLDDVKLETAQRGIAGQSALWIEHCKCPTGYIGQYCESCEAGYKHAVVVGEHFKQCVPCDCNKHADICDAETGRCICQHNTAGENCEICARGYYGDALKGTADDCLPCGCPNGGPCLQLDEDIMCTECPQGYTGTRCDSCSDGFFGDPTGRFGSKMPCQQCECNLNIDTNAIGNCNTTTGECLKCIHNTGGSRCELCLPGFYGDALALPKGDCQQCACYSAGTEEGDDHISVCDQETGACSCKPHVIGKNCDLCEEGFYNIISGDGCQSCGCNPIGSWNSTCNINTGQCFCRSGITGLRCDQCESYKYGFSSEGCKDCDCDNIGSKSLQCDTYGQCPCLDNVEGRKCDRCKENKYDRQRGCVDCPHCYNLVQKQAHDHLEKLKNLREILDEIERNPTVIDDEKFEEQLKGIQAEVEDLSERAKKGLGTDEKTITEKLEDIKKRQEEISKSLQDVEKNILSARANAQSGQYNITYTKQTLKEAEDTLNEAFETLESDGQSALEKAKQKSEEFGQQSDKMTKIAQEAREIADNLSDQADEIILTAGTAKNKSIEAYEIAKNATDHQKNISQELRVLRNEIGNTEIKLEQVKKITEDAHKKASETKNRALELLNQAKNLIIPKVDLTTIRDHAEVNKNEAKKILNETNMLLDEYDDVLDNIKQLIIEGHETLDKATHQTDDANKLLNDIKFYKTQAVEAVQLSDNTLKDATATYDALNHFDMQAKESQNAAKQALDQIPEILQMINETLIKTEEAEDSLMGAKLHAHEALDKAKQANELANNASKRAGEFLNEVQLLNNNATKLKTEAELMSGRADNTKSEFDLLLDKVSSNSSLIGEAKEKVGRASKDANEALDKVKGISDDVDGIMKELQSLPNFDDNELDRLEEELKRAEQKVKDAKLYEVLERLQSQQKKQKALMDMYNEQIDYLRKEVDNIEQIVNALPDGCFKQVQLEP